ncbi:MAG: DUF6483 family protein [Firmicutes bacterium]|nr:DUF6483 family protein [Bacillota bacterium]
MDIIEQLINGTAKVLAKILTGAEAKNELFFETEELSPRDMHYIVHALISQNRLDEAENYMFAQLELAPSLELFRIGLDAYARLAAMSDSELTTGNFTRGEVARGLADWQKLGKELPLL